jgi:hypothetical protein
MKLGKVQKSDKQTIPKIAKPDFAILAFYEPYKKRNLPDSRQ